MLCRWQGFAGRKLSTVWSSQRGHTASWHFCGLRREPVNAMWAVVNLRRKKNRGRKKKTSWELYNINFQRLLISTQMARVFLGIGTHTIHIQTQNYQIFKVDNMGLTVKLGQYNPDSGVEMLKYIKPLVQMIQGVVENVYIHRVSCDAFGTWNIM